MHVLSMDDICSECGKKKHIVALYIEDHTKLKEVGDHAEIDSHMVKRKLCSSCYDKDPDDTVDMEVMHLRVDKEDDIVGFLTKIA